MFSAKSLKQTLIVPEILPGGEVTYRVLKNTIAGALALKLGVEIPFIIKNLKVDKDHEDFRERRYFIKQQLAPITPESGLEVFGMKITSAYEPVYLMGSKRSTVLYALPEIARRLKVLYNTPEESQAYRAPMNEFPMKYGLFEISGLTVKVVPDEQGDMSYDGLGFASSDVMDALGAQNLIQFRAVSTGLSVGGVLKGLLKRDSSLPSGTICFTESQLKGKAKEFKDAHVSSIWLGVMRQYNQMSRCRMSWTIHDLLDFQILKERYSSEAKEKAHELMDIASDVYKAGDYLGLFDEERENDNFTILQQLIRIAAGAQNSNLPSLALHPFVQKGMAEIVGGSLRDLALNGPWRLPYLISTGCTKAHGDKAVLCHVGEINQTVTLHRFPFILAGVTARVVGRPELENEIICSTDVRDAISLDDDGDAVVVSDDPDFVAATEIARTRLAGNIEKCKQKKASTWWEFLDVLSEQAATSGGIGTCTYATISSAIAKKYDIARVCATNLQRATDSRKHQVRADIDYCRKVYEEFGLPPWISVGKNEKAQFRTKCDSFPGSNLWEAVRKVWETRRQEQEDKSLSLRCYANIFGFTHGLNKQEYRECLTMYRYWCKTVKKISETTQDENERQEKISQLSDLLRHQASGMDRRHAIASWEIAHSQQSKQNRGAYCFLVWKDHILPLLAEIYQSKELKHLDSSDDINLTKEQYMALNKGLRGRLIPTGENVQFAHSEPDPEKHADCKHLRTIAIVNIKGVNPEALGAAFTNDEIEIQEDASRPLPALGLNGLNVLRNGIKVAEVADSSVEAYLESGGMKNCEVLTYSRSLKIVSIN